MDASFRSLIAAGLEACIGIVRSRKGPEDVPASRALLVAALAGFVALGFVQAAIPAPDSRGNAIVLIVLEAGAWLAGVRLILLGARRPERFLQVAIAIFGCQLVLAPLQILSHWMLVTFIRRPGLAELAIMLSLALQVWLLVIAARILRSATGWSMLYSVLLALSIQMFIGLIYMSLYPPAPVAATGT